MDFREFQVTISRSPHPEPAADNKPVDECFDMY